MSEMRCGEVVGANQPLRITTRPMPECPEEGLLVRTLYAGVCHSDIHILEDALQLGQLGMYRHSEALENNGQSFEGLVLGHEICGTVEAIGKQVVSDECSLRCGDQVIVYPWRGCQQCEVCDSGDSNMCENNKSATTDIGQGQYGGGFGEIVVVPEHKLAVKVPVSIPPHIACMLPCSAGVAYRAIVKARPVLDAAIRTRGVANLLVIGCGGLGQWVVILVKAILCNPNIKVVCADLNKKKLESVEKLGADDVIEWSAQKTINDLVSATTVSGYNKIDATIDLVANPYTVEIAFRSLHNGGTIVCIGLAGGEIPISLPMLITKNISIQGLRVLGLQQFKEFVDLFGVQNGNVYPAVTYFSLDNINDAIEKLRKGEISGRAIIKYI